MTAVVVVASVVVVVASVVVVVAAVVAGAAVVVVSSAASPAHPANAIMLNTVNTAISLKIVVLRDMFCLSL
jgi:hypothetical protein